MNFVFERYLYYQRTGNIRVVNQRKIAATNLSSGFAGSSSNFSVVCAVGPFRFNLGINDLRLE